ncbi:hypothetical protein DV872_22790 [Oceanispirochaeta sp. M1]|nr:hypothetical protein DV872_22790 [Oceanispirochaeta sp. M1]
MYGPSVTDYKTRNQNNQISIWLTTSLLQLENITPCFHNLFINIGGGIGVLWSEKNPGLYTLDQWFK